MCKGLENVPDPEFLVGKKQGRSNKIGLFTQEHSLGLSKEVLSQFVLNMKLFTILNVERAKMKVKAVEMRKNPKEFFIMSS